MGRLTVRDIVKMKGSRKIVMITAYDYPTAKLVDKAGVDVVFPLVSVATTLTFPSVDCSVIEVALYFPSTLNPAGKCKVSFEKYLFLNLG
ncbi:MAG TPA: hypothetical protein EYP03_02330 [Aquificae bacterium]|nr:hypothetical protein [Aquificota bacterium]